MEENARGDQQPPQDSRRDEAPRVIGPLLQPPGNQSHRTTNFYIDNILRPDFGCKRKDKTLALEGEDAGNIRGRQRLVGRKVSKAESQKPVGAGIEETTGAPGDRRSRPRRPHITSSDVAAPGLCSSPRAASAPADKPMLWPAWVYCTRYSDRPSSGWWINNL